MDSFARNDTSKTVVAVYFGRFSAWVDQPRADGSHR